MVFSKTCAQQENIRCFALRISSKENIELAHLVSSRAQYIHPERLGEEIMRSSDLRTQDNTGFCFLIQELDSIPTSLVT